MFLGSRPRPTPKGWGHNVPKKFETSYMRADGTRKSTRKSNQICTAIKRVERKILTGSTAPPARPLDKKILQHECFQKCFRAIYLRQPS